MSMRPKNYVIAGGLVLAVGLMALLSAPRQAKNTGKTTAPAGSASAASHGDATPCPKGQLDDFGVCVPVAQTPSPAHGEAAEPRPSSDKR